MQAGKLRHRVVIQQRVTGSPQKTESGADDTSWEDFARRWASIEPLRGKEFFESQAVQSSIAVRISFRFCAGITAAMRVKYGTTIYSIDAPPTNVGTRNRETQLMCSQGANNG